MFGWSSSEADLAPGRFTHRLDTLTGAGHFYFNLKLLIRNPWTVVMVSVYLGLLEAVTAARGLSLVVVHRSLAVASLVSKRNV